MFYSLLMIARHALRAANSPVAPCWRFAAVVSLSVTEQSHGHCAPLRTEVEIKTEINRMLVKPQSSQILARFMILHNSWIKTVREHFPWSNLYIVLRSTVEGPQVWLLLPPNQCWFRNEPQADLGSNNQHWSGGESRFEIVPTILTRVVVTCPVWRTPTKGSNITLSLPKVINIKFPL